jgi:hypothetical protein
MININTWLLHEFPIAPWTPFAHGSGQNKLTPYLESRSKSLKKMIKSGLLSPKDACLS